MKKIDQTVFDKGLGNCFSACLASIFEVNIDGVPNFWETTRDSIEFWESVNEWSEANYGLRCLVFTIDMHHKFYIKNMTCIAIGKTNRGDEDHAVIWKDGLIHDPHPDKIGLVDEPDTFVMFIPLHPIWKKLKDAEDER